MTETNRWIALVVLCTGMLMIILDSTVVNVALPSIQSDLHFSQSSLAWVINAYLISFGGLLLLAGRLGDLLGRRRIFLIGLALFTTASALCGFADSRALLIGARFVQGIGGALTSAVILGMIVTMFPAPHEQGRAIGVYSFVASGGASIGLLAGGVLTQTLDWHWIFFVNVPIGILTWIAASRLLVHEPGSLTVRGANLPGSVTPGSVSPGAGRPGADSPGAVLIVSALMLGVYTIVGAATHGWASAHTLGLGAIAVALFVGFLVREGRAREPLMPLAILRARVPAAANIVQVLAVAGLFGTFFLGALYLQRVLHYGAIDIGLAFLPLSLGIGTLSLGFTARIGERYGARPTLVSGLVLLLGGLLLFSRAPVDGRYVSDLLPAMLLLGVGAGLMFPTVMTLAMSGADASDSGLLSGLANTSQQVGGALGLAILATLASTRTHSLLIDGATNANALTSGYHLAFEVAAGFLAAGAILAGFLLAPVRATVSNTETETFEPAIALELAD